MGARRVAAARRRLRGPGRGLRVRAGALRLRRRHEPGGRLLALRAVAARPGVGARLDHGGQRRDLRRAPRGLRRGRTRHGPRPVVPVPDGQARVARGLRPRGPGDGENGPHHRGRVAAQAADDEPRVADRPARRPALPARLRPALRADDRLAPRAALRLARASRGHRRRRAAARAAAGLRRGARGPRRAARRGDRGRLAPCASAPARALLRAHHGLGRRRALRPPPPRHARGLGRGGGHAMTYRGKRALDLALGGLALALAAPGLALAALLIRLESPGHPIYRQRRVGRDGRPFEVYKLRTMVTGAERMGAGLAVDEGDDRITRVGAFLRRTSLDELPNLVNVLRGEMSIVGPRPTVQVQVDRYTERQRGRLALRPGITGWAQVQGRASLPWPERIELDLWYIEHQSLVVDLRVLWLTARMVFTGHGLYRGEAGGWRDPPA